MKFLFSVSFFIVIVSFLSSTIINVPADQPTIQAGIDVAVDGDTVMVADGTYTGTDNMNLDFCGKSIAVKSVNGADSTIIDCEYSGRGFYFHSNEGPYSILSGFKIINGFSSMYWPVSGGAGILCTENSSPTIKNCVLIGNLADENGGGICCYDNSTPTIENCTFDTNSAYYGGGIYCCETSPTIVNCIFNGNWAGENGGGICCFYGSVSLIENCTFSENSAMFGGGIKCWNNSCPIINNCILSGNWADEYGGGIDCAYWCNPTIEYCTIIGNSSELGAGISCTNECNPEITNCTISENSANENGGGIWCHNSSTIIINSIVSDNSNYGIYVDSGNPSIWYSDFWNNESGNFYNCGTGVGINMTTNVNGDSCDIYYNIQLEPLFADPQNGDFHLTWTNFPIPDETKSPCIDAGDPNSPHNPDSTIADMGAYYYDQGTGTENYELHPAIAGSKLNNYPNPFNPTTTISFSVTQSAVSGSDGYSFVTLEIYNIKGQKVKTLVNETIPAGEHSVVWDGKNTNNKAVASGIYFYNLKVGNKSLATKKCLLLK